MQAAAVVAAAVAAECLFNLLCRKRATVQDCSALVTGMLLAELDIRTVKENPRLFHVVAWRLIIAPLAVAVILGQYALRLRLRHNKRRGSPNQQALRRWQEVERLSRLRKETPPEELLSLARKARFSQHTLEEQELQLLQQAVNRLIEKLKQLPLSRRLWHQQRSEKHCRPDRRIYCRHRQNSR